MALADLIQTDAPISPGNSGDVVLDADGDMIGISEACIPPQAGAFSLGLAIPASTAIDVAEQLRTTGGARRAFAGLEPAAITGQVAAQLRLPDTEDLIVTGLVPGGRDRGLPLPAAPQTRRTRALRRGNDLIRASILV